MDASDEDCGRWDIECRKLQRAIGNAAYYRRANFKPSIIRRILQQGCCSVAFVGHQGGKLTKGGIVTYPEKGGVTVILPDPAFEAQLRAAFDKNGCNSCTITIYACGGAAKEATTTRQGIANRTLCIVKGAIPPAMQGGFITVGQCPGQTWQSLDPNAEPSPDDVDFGKFGSCTGPVTLKRYVPQAD